MRSISDLRPGAPRRGGSAACHPRRSARPVGRNAVRVGHSAYRRIVMAVSVAALLATAAPAAAATPPTLEVVAEGLDNPRGLSVGRDGAVYVAEAGRGGDDCREFPPQAGLSGTTLCFGPTGSITRVGDGEDVEVVPGLPSLAPPEGFNALGPHDVTTAGPGRFQLAIGGAPVLTDDPAASAQEGRALYSPLLGTIAQVGARGRVSVAADLLAFEERENPDGEPLPDGNDSNPYGLDAAGPYTVAVDAAGNSLLRISPSGRVRTLAVLPATDGMEAVPTDVERGPDGAWYVSRLTGFPFPVGGASIVRVPFHGGEPEVYRDGLTGVIDFTFDRRGALYVLEFQANGLLSDDPTGRLLRFAPGAEEPEVLAQDGLVFPGAVAIDRRGDIYLSNFSVLAGQGQVVRLRRGHHAGTALR
jgi:hypothetical protein